MCAAEIQADFLREIGGLDASSYLERRLLFVCAPVLKRVKPAALAAFKNSCLEVWERVAYRFFARVGLGFCALGRREETFLVLIYDRHALARLREDALSDEILREQGYPARGGQNALLAHFKGRFRGGCPHEVGLFLGYPARDVRSFIRHREKDYICCRYWKVYHDEKRARALFHAIDTAHLEAICILTRQRCIVAAAKQLRQASA